MPMQPFADALQVAHALFNRLCKYHILRNRRRKRKASGPEQLVRVVPPKPQGQRELDRRALGDWTEWNFWGETLSSLRISVGILLFSPTFPSLPHTISKSELRWHQLVWAVKRHPKPYPLLTKARSEHRPEEVIQALS